MSYLYRINLLFVVILFLSPNSFPETCRRITPDGCLSYPMPASSAIVASAFDIGKFFGNNKKNNDGHNETAVNEGKGVKTSTKDDARPGKAKLEGANLHNHEHIVTTEQDRLDTMVRALGRLPEPERQRLGVDISTPVLPNTERAEALHKAWESRQKELKSAVESMVKPAEHMAQLAQTLRNFVPGKTSTTSEEEVTAALKELESALSDIDNARDFHTIGGWPALVSMLGREHSLLHRGLAAWGIGTSIKNSYDHQLWVLESIDPSSKAAAELQAAVSVDGNSLLHNKEKTPGQMTCLELLVDLLAGTSNPTDNADVSSSSSSSVSQSQETSRRALYAISSAARGNMDVQEMLLTLEFLPRLSSLASSNTTTDPELRRKIWSFISDMLEESSFIRNELSESTQSLISPTASVEDREAVRADIARQLKELKLIGDELCKDSAWTLDASTSLGRILFDEQTKKMLLSSKPSVEAIPIRATLDSLITVLGELTKQCHDTHWISSLKAIVIEQIRSISVTFSSSHPNESLVEKAESVLVKLSA